MATTPRRRRARSTSDGTAALPAAELGLVAYSTPQAAYDQITEAFTKTAEGKNITFTKSYGASGDQSRAVEAGLRGRLRRPSRSSRT